MQEDRETCMAITCLQAETEKSNETFKQNVSLSPRTSHVDCNQH